MTCYETLLATVAAISMMVGANNAYAAGAPQPIKIVVSPSALGTPAVDDAVNAAVQLQALLYDYHCYDRYTYVAPDVDTIDGNGKYFPPDYDFSNCEPW